MTTLSPPRSRAFYSKLCVKLDKVSEYPKKDNAVCNKPDFVEDPINTNLCLKNESIVNFKSDSDYCSRSNDVKNSELLVFPEQIVYVGKMNCSFHGVLISFDKFACLLSKNELKAKEWKKCLDQNMQTEIDEDSNNDKSRNNTTINTEGNGVQK